MMLPERVEAMLADAALVRLRAMFDERNDVVVSLVGADLTVLWASETGATGIYRRDRVEYVGRSTLEFVHPDDRAEFRRRFEQATAGATVRYTVRASREDGGWVEVRSVMWPTLDRDAVVVITVPSASAGEGDAWTSP